MFTTAEIHTDEQYGHFNTLSLSYALSLAQTLNGQESLEIKTVSL